MMTHARTSSTRRTAGIAVAALACIAGPATAQVDPRAQGVEALQPLDPGSIDSSPLADSMRLLPIDLRMPTGFDQVYRVDTAHGPAFARMDGGLRAVFPRSEYGAGEAQVPAGTTWVIGDTPTWYADRFGMIATAPADAAGPLAPGAGVLAQRLDLSARAIDGWAGSTYAGTNAAPLAAPMIDGVRVPMARPLIRIDDRAPGTPDLAGLLASPRAAHRTVIAGEPEQAVVEQASASEPEEARRDANDGSPWADDQARGRTIAFLLLKAAGSDDVRQRDAVDEETVATVETNDE